MLVTAVAGATVDPQGIVHIQVCGIADHLEKDCVRTL
jgi:hypothetical protein